MVRVRTRSTVWSFKGDIADNVFRFLPTPSFFFQVGQRLYEEQRGQIALEEIV
jgi:hypothetical protein